MKTRKYFALGLALLMLMPSQVMAEELTAPETAEVATEVATEESKQHMLEGQYWNYSTKSNFSDGNITLGLVTIPQKQDCWLLFHIGKVTKDLNIKDGIGYEFEELDEYKEYYRKVIE